MIETRHFHPMRNSSPTKKHTHTQHNNQMETKSTMQNSSSLLNRISSEDTAQSTHTDAMLAHLVMCRIDSVVLLAGNIYLPYVSYSLESYFVAQFFLSSLPLPSPPHSPSRCCCLRACIVELQHCRK